MDDHEHAQMLQIKMAELTERFSATTNISVIFESVTSACVDLISGVDFADILMIAGPDQFKSVAPTDQVAVTVDGFQRTAREGPCLDAAIGEGVVRCNDLRHDVRWPQFAASAVEAGIRSMMSFHLYTHKAQMGALNMFGSAPDVLGAEAEALGTMLATHAAIAVIDANKEHQFLSALARRDTIGQAKGMIMERFGVDAVRAFELLKKLSQDSNTRLADVAAEVVDRGPDPGGKPAPGPMPGGRLD